MWLRFGTNGQEILLGRFVNSTDGNTEETGLTIANTDIKLWVEGATTLTNKNSGGATHIANGMYYCVLNAADTNTLGKLEVHVHVAGALSVRREFMVLPTMVYDSLVLDSDVLQTDVAQWLGDSPESPEVPGVPHVQVVYPGSLVDMAADYSGGVLAVGSLGATAQGNVRTAVGLASANLDTQLGDIPTNSELATALITGLTTALTEGYRGTGATGSVRDLLYEIIAHMGESSIAGTTKTLKKLDGSTTAKTYTLDSSTTPTAITETT